jgi:hypothetical protein
MEEINIDIVSRPESPPLPNNENEYLLMVTDFKNRINEKNKIIQDLKKTLCVSYGLTIILEKYEDISIVAILSEYLDEKIEKHLKIESPI